MELSLPSWCRRHPILLTSVVVLTGSISVVFLGSTISLLLLFGCGLTVLAVRMFGQSKVTRTILAIVVYVGLPIYLLYLLRPAILFVVNFSFWFVVGVTGMIGALKFFTWKDPISRNGTSTTTNVIRSGGTSDNAIETADETIQDALVQQETVQDELVHRETVQDTTVHRETVQDATVHRETVQDELIHRETVQQTFSQNMLNRTNLLPSLLENEKSAVPSNKNQLIEESSSSTCVICEANPKCVVFLPCAHLCACKDCRDELLEKTNKCPMCRGTIDDTMLVYS